MTEHSALRETDSEWYAVRCVIAAMDPQSYLMAFFDTGDECQARV